MTRLKRIAAYLLAGSLALSCVYPYEAELDSIAGALVIEGDLILGDEVQIRVSRAQSLDGTYYSIGMNTVPAKVWAEDDQGNTYPDVAGVIDLREAPGDRSYRLHVADLDGGKNYVSSWREPQLAPVIDEVRYDVESIENPTSVSRPRCKARLTMHAQEGASRYFRWDYEQEWQYHANYAILLDYNPPSDSFSPIYDDSNYWCWSKSRSSETQIAVAIGDERNRIQDHVFLEFYAGAGALFQKRYGLHVIARGISEECYQYLHTLQLNSNTSGDLFSPNPSELRGNISCEEDPDELVLGFIEVSRTSAVWSFLPDGPGVYRDPGQGSYDGLKEFTTPGDRSLHYGNGWRPIDWVESETGSYVGWAPPSWCDCRFAGGTNEKPSYWED